MVLTYSDKQFQNMTWGLEAYNRQINFIAMQGGSPQGKISFSFAGGSPSQSQGTPRGERKVVVSQIQPARVSPAPRDHEVVRTQPSPLMRISPQQLKRVIITNNPQPGLVNPPPPQMVVSHQPVQYSPFKRMESNTNKEEIAQNIYEKLELINSKLQKMTQLELQNTLLKNQNKKLKGENDDQKEEEKQEKQEQEDREVAAEQKPEQKQSRQQTLQKIVEEKDLSIRYLQQQNQETKRQLQAFKSRFNRGRQILTKILELEDLKDHELIGELSEVFDD